jgi:uncharacterized protein (TIGR00369 family)
MKQLLSKLIETIIEQGSEKDLEVLSYAIEGLSQKSAGKSRTYLEGLLHMEQKLDENTCEITIPINDLVDNSFGMLHGGITSTILDTAMGVLANHLTPDGFGVVTNQLNIHFLAPGVGEYLRCRAEAIHRGKKTFVISGEAFRSDGKKIAYATGSFFVINKQAPRGE